MSVSNPEIKKLYGLSAGRCCICKVNLFENDVHIGQMAHVIAKSEDGPRGEEKLSSERDSYENLILLCANHHIEIDKNINCYSVEKLHQIKKEHEEGITSMFEDPNGKTDDINSLNLLMRFIPFTQLQHLVGSLPISINLKFSEVADAFEAFRESNPHLYPFNNPHLDIKFYNFIKCYYKLWNIISGFSEVDKRSQPNFSQADSRMNIYLDQVNLPYERKVMLSQEVETLKSHFIAEYLNLMEYLRLNYPKVQLNTYEKELF